MMTQEQASIDKQQELAKRIKDGAIPKGFDIPGWSTTYPLYDHQLQGAVWLYLTPRAILADSVGLGKAQPLTSKILTPAGWTTMGELKVGDRIIGTNGAPCNVTGIFPQGKKEVVRVKFKDGSVVECCEDHLWTLEKGESRFGETLDNGKREYLGNALYKKTAPISYFENKVSVLAYGTKANKTGLRYKWSLPEQSPIEFLPLEYSLDIDPYMLGCLIGDGGLSVNSRVGFTTSDAFIADEMRKNMDPGSQLVKNKAKYAYAINGILKQPDSQYKRNPTREHLESYGLMGKLSYEKHIPTHYLYSSISERLSLLQGLMDTDGTPSHSSGEFSTTSPVLAQQVVGLVRSLGGVASCKSRYTYYTYKGEKKRGRLSFRVIINIDMPMFRLPRKLEKMSPRRRKHRRLISIERTGKSVPMQCISVDSPDNLYITDDFVPTHNTSVTLGLLQILKSRDLINKENRVLIVVPATSVYGSWAADGFEKFEVKIDYAIGRGTKAQRLKVYEDPSWEILLTNYETVRVDIHHLEALGFKHVILDESDYIKNHATQTAQAIKRITVDAERVVAVSATPIQNTLLDLHSVLEALNLKNVFGSKTAFDKRYHEHVVRQIRTRKRTIYKKEVVGFKNTAELKEKLAPYYLRRTYKDVDVKIPELQSQIKWIEMTPEQKQMYGHITQGFAKLTANSPPAEIKAAVLRLRQCCTSTATVGADYDSSGKFDWLLHQLQNDWLDNKVVVFNNWKASIKALEKRLDEAGIGFVTMTSDQNNQKLREADRQKFWNDPKCRVLLGTTAIEKSLNLQCANIQVNMDMLYNPSRHQQLAGRVHRVGSIHDNAWVFSLLTKNSVEEGVMQMLKQKQAISDHVLDDTSEIFEKLTTRELFNLIRS